MSIKPILFSGPMVRALLAGTKTQTRRVLKDQPAGNEQIGGGTCDPAYSPKRPYLWLNGHDGSVVRFIRKAPTVVPGDVLYVREAWRTECSSFDDLPPCELEIGTTVLFEADADWSDNKSVGRLRAGLHMPRWASRLTLTVTSVRIQRLQEINNGDAVSEGVTEYHPEVAWMAYQRLWDSINAERGHSWNTDPYVVAYTFSVAKGNVDVE